MMALFPTPAWPQSKILLIFPILHLFFPGQLLNLAQFWKQKTINEIND